MVFMQHHRNFAVAHTHHHFDMPANHCAQALFGIGNILHGVDDPLLSDVQRVIHQVKQDLVFALEMMVQTSLAEFKRGSHIVHGSSVVALLLEKSSGQCAGCPGVNQWQCREALRKEYTDRIQIANRRRPG